jgi:hypothetical protein
VLLLEELLDDPVVPPGRDLLRVGQLLRGEDLAADVHQGLDLGCRLPLVFRLDVEDPVVVADVGVVPGDHGPKF